MFIYDSLPTYNLLLYLHLMGFLGWAGPTTGAYYVVALSNTWRDEILKAYRKLFYVELVSISLAAVTGGMLWEMLGRPSWATWAFLMAPPLGFMEYYHFQLTRDVNRFRRGMRSLSLLYTVAFFVLMYIMVFKP
jgi:hypothetical protein